MRAVPTLTSILTGALVSCEPGPDSDTLAIDDRFVVRLNLECGDSGLFLIDTGSDQSVVDAAAAKRWGLPIRDDLRVVTTDVAGHRTIGRVSPAFAGLRLGRLRVPPVDVTIAPIPAVHRIDGIVGNDVIRQFVWAFDVPNGRVTVSRAGSPATDRKGQRVDIEMAGDLAFVTLNLPSGRSTRLLLDSGATQSVLPASFIESEGLESAGDLFQRQLRDRKVQALKKAIEDAGIENYRMTVDDSLPRSVTGFSGHRTPVADYLLPESRLGKTRLGLLIVSGMDSKHGFLGRDVLAKKEWTLDLIQRAIWISRE